MKINTLLISLLLLSLFPSVVKANACEKGHPWSIAYILRDENRCEGLLDLPIAGDSIPDLISFGTTNLTEYPNQLKIQVPGDGSQEPRIRIQSWLKRYKLDQLKTEYLQTYFTFDLNTKKVLQHPQAKVPLESLRSLAFIVEDSEPVYFPVILSENSGAYEFVIQCLQPTTFPVLEIRYQGEPVFENPRNNSQRGHVRLTWNHQNQPAGRYELYFENSEGVSRSFPFEHDPSWFDN